MSVHPWAPRGPLGLATLVLMLAVCGGCSQDGEESGAESADASEEPEAKAAPKAINVETTVLEVEPFRRVVTYAGETRPSVQTELTPDTNGRLLDFELELNQVIEADALIARLDTRMASSQIRQAKAELKNARTALKRIEPLLSERLVTPQQVEEAEGRIRSAKASLSAARTSKDLAEVRSPTRGVVVVKHMENGEYASPGQPIVAIADLWTIQVDIHIPEDEVRYVSEGMPLDLRIPALGERGEVTGIVNRIGFVANANNRTFPVEINIPNPDLEIRGGMLVFADVVQIDLSEVVVVERDAVLDSSKGQHVFVADRAAYRQKRSETDGDDDATKDQIRALAVRKVVSLGPGAKKRVVVTEGLEPGDELVVVGQRQVSNGDIIRILEYDDDDETGDSSPTAKAATDDPKAASDEEVGKP